MRGGRSLPRKRSGLRGGVNERDWQCIFAVLWLDLFIRIFFCVFVQLATEMGAAVVAGIFRAAAVGESARECDAAAVAFVGGGTGAGAWRWEGDIAGIAAFEGTFAFGGEGREGVVAVEAM